MRRSTRETIQAALNERNEMAIELGDAHRTISMIASEFRVITGGPLPSAVRLPRLEEILDQYYKRRNEMWRP